MGEAEVDHFLNDQIHKCNQFLKGGLEFILFKYLLNETKHQKFGTYSFKKIATLTMFLAKKKSHFAKNFLTS